ncbi:hypothetical protein CCH79_00004577 [Gambusia affinis]|uniref:Uncharacterized protein n=1 Tax=Gambusia affinis TaxID=33528 RepID=A0A315UYB8_GAMAF|nr:hypothetical protein CCH79_00004577 [Gambusia affinis]
MEIPKKTTALMYFDLLSRIKAKNIFTVSGGQELPAERGSILSHHINPTKEADKTKARKDGSKQTRPLIELKLYPAEMRRIRVEPPLCAGCSSASAPRMEDEEDDVFEPDPNCWRTPFREIKCEDRGTQTPGPGQALHNGMLPCGVVEEPRRLFYAHFELVGDFDARQQEEQNRMEQLPLHQPAALSLEACIGQKLQLIGDQFHREHLQQVRGNDAPSLLRVALFCILHHHVWLQVFSMGAPCPRRNKGLGSAGVLVDVDR